MDINFPTINDNKLYEKIKKDGILKTWLVHILFYYVPAALLFSGQLYFGNKDIKKEIQNIVIQEQSQDQSQSQNQNIVLGQSELLSKSVSSEIKPSSAFNSKDWFIDKFREEGGFYCPTTRSYEYWSMWTKQEFPVTVDRIRIKFQIKQTSDTPPTISLSYGSYFGSTIGQEQAYRLNIFDDGPQSIRLYGSKSNKSLDQSYLEKEVDLDSDMTLEVEPRVLDSKGRTIRINPILKYAVFNSGEQEDHRPKGNFEVMLPMVEIEDPSSKKQFGIGTRYGNCFKIISFEVIP